MSRLSGRLAAHVLLLVIVVALMGVIVSHALDQWRLR